MDHQGGTLGNVRTEALRAHRHLSMRSCSTKYMARRPSTAKMFEGWDLLDGSPGRHPRQRPHRGPARAPASVHEVVQHEVHGAQAEHGEDVRGMGSSGWITREAPSATSAPRPCARTGICP